MERRRDAPSSTYSINGKQYVVYPCVAYVLSRAPSLATAFTPTHFRRRHSRKEHVVQGMKRMQVLLLGQLGVVIVLATALAIGIGSASAMRSVTAKPTAITASAGEFYFTLSKTSIPKPGTVTLHRDQQGHDHARLLDPVTAQDHEDACTASEAGPDRDVQEEGQLLLRVPGATRRPGGHGRSFTVKVDRESRSSSHETASGWLRDRGQPLRRLGPGKCRTHLRGERERR